MGERWESTRQYIGTCVITGLFLCLSPIQSWAKAPAGASLNLSRDAKLDSLGPGFVAVADNSGGSIHLNPAGLSNIKQAEISAFHSSYLLDSRMTALHMAHPIGKFTLGLGYFSFGVDDLDGRNADGGKTNPFSARDQIASLSIARPIRSTSLGVTIKMFQSHLADLKAATQALDVGLLHNIRRSGLSLGASLRNIGPGIQYTDTKEPLPLTLALGTGYRFSRIPIGLVMGASRIMATGKTDFSVGVQTTVSDLLSLRGMYLLPVAGAIPSLQTSGSLVGGFGLKISNNYHFDGSIATMGANADLGMVAKFNFTVKFGAIRNARPDRRIITRSRVNTLEPTAQKLPNTTTQNLEDLKTEGTWVLIPQGTMVGFRDE
ncbi:MAG: hypothetical protein HY401_09940 [Elusimicrobia bacterium]|nr:hypothetical protein [Elusimicrobiota bacterium]